MQREIILDNARIVFEDGIVPGHMVLRDGRIAVVDRGCIGLSCARDMQGDLLAPLPRQRRHEVDALLKAAWLLHDRIGLGLPEAFDTLVGAPARWLRLHDCAAIDVGRRADLVRVAMSTDGLVARELWRDGIPLGRPAPDGRYGSRHPGHGTSMSARAGTGAASAPAASRPAGPGPD